VGRRESEETTRPEAVGCGVQDVPRLRQMLEDLPEDDRARAFTLLQDLLGTIALGDPHADDLTQLLAGSLVAFDDLHIEPGVLGSVGEEAAPGAHFHEIATVQVPAQQLDLPALLAGDVGQLLPGREAEVVPGVIGTEIAGSVLQEEQPAPGAAEVGEGFGGDAAIAVRRDERPSGVCPAEGAARHGGGAAWGSWGSWGATRGRVTGFIRRAYAAGHAERRR